jgi:hypothetical protein
MLRAFGSPVKREAQVERHTFQAVRDEPLHTMAFSITGVPVRL